MTKNTLLFALLMTGIVANIGMALIRKDVHSAIGWALAGMWYAVAWSERYA